MSALAGMGLHDSRWGLGCVDAYSFFGHSHDITNKRQTFVCACGPRWVVFHKHSPSTQLVGISGPSLEPTLLCKVLQPATACEWDDSETPSTASLRVDLVVGGCGVWPLHTDATSQALHLHSPFQRFPRDLGILCSQRLLWRHAPT